MLCDGGQVQPEPVRLPSLVLLLFLARELGFAFAHKRDVLIDRGDLLGQCVVVELRRLLAQGWGIG